VSAELWKQFEGQSIENTYHLKGLLGSGGFGGVFLADHVVEGALIRQVAVKLILPDAQYFHWQLTELVAATNLRHDHLVACFHAGSAMLGQLKLLYLVMEVAQGTLQQRIEQGVLPAAQAMMLAVDLAFALEYLHRQRHIHRDLKPGNVLRVGEDWKLSDFGTMRQSAETTSHTGLVMGTLTYMPPESFDGVISPAWDTWSLGAILLVALSGKKPYGDITESQLLRAIVEQDPVIPSDLPAPFGEIVRGCLTRDYKARWTARQVGEALHGFHKTRASALKAEAGEHRNAGRPAAALTALREARHLDLADTELDTLISEEEDRQRRISLLQVEAVKATAAGRHEEALQAWQQMLLLDPANEGALAAVREIERKKRALQEQEMRQQAGEAVLGGDFSRAQDLIRQLQVGTAAPKTPVKTATWSRLAIGLAIGLFVGGLAWLLFKPTESSRDQGPPETHMEGSETRARSQATQQPALAASVSAPKTEPPAYREPPPENPTEKPSVRLQGVQTNPKDGLPYVWIPPGKFMMGCSPGDRECGNDEKPPHAEQIANGFWLGQTEVTQAAWKKVMNNNPSYFKGDQLPVDQVDLSQAGDYCKAIGGRLPTEKEWEYAARAGTTGARYGPIDAIAWYSENMDGKTHPVALKQANAYGLYDMLGNVWEWTSEDYDAGHKVVRGGSWLDSARGVRASFRDRDVPTNRFSNLGFRCVGEFR
jgi:formylglycine-generating enzyme required for sulfatase activity